MGGSERKNANTGRHCFCNGDTGSAVCNASPRSEARSKLPGAGRAGSPAPGGHLSVLREGQARPSAGPCVVLTAAAAPHWGLLPPSSFLISSSSSSLSQEGSFYCLNRRPYTAYISTTRGVSWRLVQIVTVRPPSWVPLTTLPKHNSPEDLEVWEIIVKEGSKTAQGPRKAGSGVHVSLVYPLRPDSNRS